MESKMKYDKELTYDVYICDYQVTEEAASDIVEYVSDGACPLCKNDNNGPGEMPEPGNTSIFKCSVCDTEITVEAWWVK
jgi:hypothetical protein